jgi:uridine kinase
MCILVTGAAGSGTSTLAAALAAQIGGTHLDADDYYWQSGSPPYRDRRAPDERLALLQRDLQASIRPVLAGSVVGWGVEIEDGFDLVVFLVLDARTRLERLRRREIETFGHADPDFLAWAAQYDQGPPVGRSLAVHRRWLAARRCPVIELHGPLTVGERVAAVLHRLPA